MEATQLWRLQGGYKRLRIFSNASRSTVQPQTSESAPKCFCTYTISMVSIPGKNVNKNDCQIVSLLVSRKSEVHWPLIPPLLKCILFEVEVENSNNNGRRRRAEAEEQNFPAQNHLTESHCPFRRVVDPQSATPCIKRWEGRKWEVSSGSAANGQVSERALAFHPILHYTYVCTYLCTTVQRQRSKQVMFMLYIRD